MIHQKFLSIKEPCSQVWETMHFSEKGRFCNSCQKQVHDFSNSSFDQIRQAYSESNGSLCGRLTGMQLHKQYVDSQIERAHVSYTKRFCLAVIVCFGTSLFSIQSSKATVFSHLKNNFFKIVSDTNMIEICGVVADKETKEVMPFVTVSLLEGDSLIAMVETDSLGEYKFNVDTKKNTKLRMEVKSVGYALALKELILENSVSINIDLEVIPIMLGGMGFQTISIPIKHFSYPNIVDTPPIKIED